MVIWPGNDKGRELSIKVKFNNYQDNPGITKDLWYDLIDTALESMDTDKKAGVYEGVCNYLMNVELEDESGYATPDGKTCGLLSKHFMEYCIERGLKRPEHGAYWLGALNMGNWYFRRKVLEEFGRYGHEHGIYSYYSLFCRPKEII